MAGLGFGVLGCYVGLVKFSSSCYVEVVEAFFLKADHFFVVESVWRYLIISDH